ncbi:uncharacterized protein ISCGN_030881 [Ixodes scapularis]
MCIARSNRSKGCYEAIFWGDYLHCTVDLAGQASWSLNLGRRVLKYLMYKNINTRLTKQVARLVGKYEVPLNLLDGQLLREGVANHKKRVQEVETRRWTESAPRKPTMTTYAGSKVVIMREQIYDYRGSRLLFEARTRALKMRVCKSHFDTKSPTNCVVCGEAEETIEHQMLQCPQPLSPGGQAAGGTGFLDGRQGGGQRGTS